MCECAFVLLVESLPIQSQSDHGHFSSVLVLDKLVLNNYGKSVMIYSSTFTIMIIVGSIGAINGFMGLTILSRKDLSSISRIYDKNKEAYLPSVFVFSRPKWWTGKIKFVYIFVWTLLFPRSIVFLFATRGWFGFT